MKKRVSKFLVGAFVVSMGILSCTPDQDTIPLDIPVEQIDEDEKPDGRLEHRPDTGTTTG